MHVPGLLCPDMVGRETELGVLLEMYEQARQGAPAILFLSGTAGVGKSRLTAAFTEQVVARDGIAVACEPASIGAEGELESILGTALETGPDAPAVLVFEDLHLADARTLTGLDRLIRRLSGSSRRAPEPMAVMILGTYRPECIAAGAPCAAFLGELSRQRINSELALGPLDPPDHTVMVSRILGRTIPRQLAAELYEYTDGNPFVVEELLRGQSDHVDSLLPGSGIYGLRLVPLQSAALAADLVCLLDGLDESVIRVLATAAIAGREFTFDLLQELTDSSEEELLCVLRAMVSKGIVDQQWNLGEPECYRFSWGWVQAALTGRLLIREQRRLHGRAADHLARGADPGGPPGQWDAIARHLILAGRLREARSFAEKAAGSASDAPTIDVTASIARLTKLLPAGEPSRFEWLEKLGHARLSTGDIAGAASALAEARSEAELGEYRLSATVPDLELRFLNEVLGRETDGDLSVLSAERVKLPNRHARSGQRDEDATVQILGSAALGALLFSSSPEAHRLAGDWAESACAAAARRSDREPLPGLARALLARGMLLSNRGEADGATRAVDSALQVARAPIDIMVSREIQLVTLQARGDDHRAVREYEMWRDGDAEIHGVIPTYPTVIWSYLTLGRWTEGIDVARATLSRAEERSLEGVATRTRLALAYLLVRTGRREEARRLLEKVTGEAVAQLGPRDAMRRMTVRAALEAADGETARAVPLYHELYDLWRVLSDRAASTASILEGCLVLISMGDTRRALIWHADLDDIARSTGHPAAVAASAECSGALSRALGDHRASVSALQQAADAWHALGRPYEHARALEQLAESILAAGPRSQQRRHQAQFLLTQATSIYGELGACDEERRTLAVLRRAALVSSARKRRLPAPRAPHGGLTPRERDVLLLIASGRTNRQIAQELFIAESTAELHVSRILGKLGCTRRSQAAGWAINQDWVLRAGGEERLLQA